MKANLQKDNPLVIGYISAIIAALLFGSVSTVTKPIVSSVNPLLLSCLVCLISGVTITPVVNRIKYSVRRKDYLLLITTSIFGAVIAPAMFFFGLKLTTAIDSSLLSNGEVIFSILLALTIFGEIDFLSTKIRELDNKIKKVASDDKYAKHLITIPGISRGIINIK
jgi:drug/metabolite transporter (DMT)-like permease